MQINMNKTLNIRITGSREPFAADKRMQIKLPKTQTAAAICSGDIVPAIALTNVEYTAANGSAHTAIIVIIKKKAYMGFIPVATVVPPVIIIITVTVTGSILIPI
jgi:hypothetical protein